MEIEGCEVTDVCDLTRHWVPTPRNLNYWVPIVDVLGRLLADRCCTPDYDRKTTDREADFLRELGSQALSLVRSPLTIRSTPALRRAPGAWSTVVPPAPASAASLRRRVARVARRRVRWASEEQRVEVLEKQVAELEGAADEARWWDAMTVARPIFTDGAILAADDLSSLEAEGRDRDARHARHLHTPGVGAGLDFTGSADRARDRRAVRRADVAGRISPDGTGRDWSWARTCRCHPIASWSRT